MSSTSVTSFLRRVPLLAKLPEWQFDMVAEVTEAIDARKGTTLITRGTDDGFTYFLASGEVSLDSPDGAERQIEVTPDTAIHPVANLRPRLFGVTALTSVHAFRVPDLVLTAAGCDRPQEEDSILDGEDSQGHSRELDGKLSFQLYQDLRANKNILPTLPDLALRIRRAIDDGDSDARKVARLVEADPAMAAKLVKAANSALYAGSGAVNSCSAAVVRLGMQTTKQLVLTFALKDVFKSHDRAVQRRMQALWKHSAQIAALCFVLARESGKANPEEALLAGLVHDVGLIVILGYAQQYPELLDDTETVRATIDRMRSELGAMVLRDWKFPPTLVAASRDAENWLRRHNREADLTDLLIVAQVHEHLRKHRLDELPPMQKITAMHRVLGDAASAEKSLDLLHAAKTHIDEMHSVLKN